MIELNHPSQLPVPASQPRSAEAIRHERQNIEAVLRAVALGHKGKCGMICAAIINGLTDAEVLDHIAIQNLRSTKGTVRTLRRDLRKAGYPVLSNAEVIAAREWRAS